MTVQCAVCGTGFEAKRATARYCSPKCRTRKHRNGGDKVTAPSGFLGATRTELERLSRADTLLGQQVLVIAERMVDGAVTGTELATLSREHSRLMAAVAAGAQAADPVDEVKKRRDAKARATTGRA